MRRILYCTTFFLVVLTLLACRRADKRKHVVQDVTSTSVVEEVEPPPSNYQGGNFSSIEDWLTDICQSVKSAAVIDEFSIGLFESQDYHLYLIGRQVSVVNNDEYSKIVFEPQFKYFKLPNTVYAGLSREQVLIKISNELKVITSSNRFRNCFLSEVKSFILEYSGENLLHR